jgi:hypothetical protein
MRYDGTTAVVGIGMNANVDIEAFAALAERTLASGDFRAVSDADLERVMTAAVRLYAAKAETSGAYPPPITVDQVTPTEVVTVVSEMLRAAGLNLFDLSMWFQRAR